MTIFELLNQATSVLKTQGTSSALELSSPMLDAELLLSHVIQTNRASLFTNLNKDVSLEHQTAFLELIARRAKHEPVAYLTGEKEFYGRSFWVSKNTLIPRPATEDLLELILKTSQNTYSTPQNSLLLDIGTGSGCLSVSLAAETGKSVIATDIDEKTLQMAQKNAERHNVANLITFEKACLSPQNTHRTLTPTTALVIAANLPYVPAETFSEVMDDVRLFEPVHALISGNDGLNLIWHLLWRMYLMLPLLPKNTHIFLEHDTLQNKEINKLVERILPTFSVNSHNDTSGTPRLTHLHNT